MQTKNKSKDDLALEWLLKNNIADVRASALHDLCGKNNEDPEYILAAHAAHSSGIIAGLQAKMHPDGYWEAPGPGYSGKYRSSVWTLITLAQLGAGIEFDARIKTACEYLLSQAFCAGGQLSSNGVPSGTVDCLQGNLCWSFVKLGYWDDRIQFAYDWLARCVTGDGIAPMQEKHTERRFYAAKCGAMFACGANNKLSCAWGAAKVMLALSALPAARQTQQTKKAIQAGIRFLLEGDPSSAPWPNGWSAKPSRNWWLFGFPVFYITDLLQVAEALTALGIGNDPRMQSLIELIRSKQDADGRWKLEYDYSGKTNAEFGEKNKPSPWVTLRALRVLNAVE